MKEKIKDILKDYIEIDKPEIPLVYKDPAGIEALSIKILQLFNDKIDSCTHDIYLQMIQGSISANEIIKIIKDKVGKDE